MFLRRGKTGLAAVFGSLELKVLEALWRRGTPSSVRDVHGGFTGVAYTTVMTTMDRLHRKGILGRQREGRAFVYEPRFSREALETATAARAVGPLLKGLSARPILSYLVDAVSREDRQLLDELDALIQAKRREPSTPEDDR